MPQLEKFKYLGVLFTSKGKIEQEIDRQIGVASAVMPTMCRSIVVKMKLSRKLKLLIYRSVFIVTLTYSRKLWVVTKTTKSLIQGAEMSGPQWLGSSLEIG